MSHFSGSVSHQIDDKNRIRIPAKFRGALGDQYSFIAGDQKCISVYPKEKLEARFEMAAQLQGDPRLKMAMRKLQSSVEDIKEDGQGRATLSAFFRDHIGLTKDDKEVLTVGMVDHLEIWKADEFEKYMEPMDFTTASNLLGF